MKRFTKGKLVIKSDKLVIDNIKFDSKLEGNRYLVLRAARDKGLIKDLVLQPRYRLLPTMDNIHHVPSLKAKKVFKSVNYTPDFRYTRISDNKVIIEEAKGFPTPVYKLRVKFFLHTLKNGEYFREVKKATQDV